MAGETSAWRRAIGFVEDNRVAVTVAFVAVASALFLAFPEIDLWVSDRFYRPGRGFFLRGNDALVLLRASSDVLVIVLVVGLFAALAVKLARPDRPSPVPPSITLFLLSSLILGPGLLVNVFFKNLWGRPRPVSVDLYGGEAPYVEVWRITDWCDRNCSFVSGEASTATWFIAVAMVMPRGVRLPAVVAVSIYAALLSLNRIVFGGHFLSDVLLSFGVTLIVILLVHRAVIERPPAWLSNAALESGLARLGRRLRWHGGGGTA
jgi:lipid A 4'-phosphatase